MKKLCYCSTVGCCKKFFFFLIFFFFANRSKRSFPTIVAWCSIKRTMEEVQKARTIAAAAGSVVLLWCAKKARGVVHKFSHLCCQRGMICLWSFFVDSSQPEDMRPFFCAARQPWVLKYKIKKIVTRPLFELSCAMTAPPSWAHAFRRISHEDSGRSEMISMLLILYSREFCDKQVEASLFFFLGFIVAFIFSRSIENEKPNLYMQILTNLGCFGQNMSSQN